MSVLIKGMEMPKNCGGCFLRVGQCSRRIYMENRPSACPLIEVHEPHGRLIDADALIIDLMDRGVESLQTDDWHEIQQVVMDAPAIIPAEEGE